MTTEKEESITAILTGEHAITENTNAARELYNQSRYGGKLETGQIQLSLHEALYLMQRDKIVVLSPEQETIEFNEFVSKAKEIEEHFWVRYCVYRDMRRRGYIVKTALKFGADFRVYDRGVKPGEDHARWVVYPVPEGGTHTWYEFAAKNRVAHSTKKRLMLGVVDNESDVTYWEVKWVRP